MTSSSTSAWDWDEDHPFTMCPSEAERLALLQEALDLADLITFETEDHPGMDNHPRVYKGLAVALAGNALEVEVNGALAADVIPLFAFDADQALEDGKGAGPRRQLRGSLDHLFRAHPGTAASEPPAGLRGQLRETLTPASVEPYRGPDHRRRLR